MFYIESGVGIESLNTQQLWYIPRNFQLYLNIIFRKTCKCLLGLRLFSSCCKRKILRARLASYRQLNNLTKVKVRSVAMRFHDNMDLRSKYETRTDVYDD